jgi:hypothetical protein
VWKALIPVDQRVLLVVDYAETRRVELAMLTNVLAQLRLGVHCRLILKALSRRPLRRRASCSMGAGPWRPASTPWRRSCRNRAIRWGLYARRRKQSNF